MCLRFTFPNRGTENKAVERRMDLLDCIMSTVTLYCHHDINKDGFSNAWKKHDIRRT